MPSKQPKKCKAVMPVSLQCLTNEGFKVLPFRGESKFKDLELKGPDTTTPYYAIVDSHNITLGVVAACKVTNKYEYDGKYLGCRYAVVYRSPCYANQGIGRAARQQVEERYPAPDKWICIAPLKSEGASMAVRLGYCPTKDQIPGFNKQFVFKKG
jgi:hypothetical protein